MLEARSRRVRPHCDDKVLASWNGLMLGAHGAGGSRCWASRRIAPPRRGTWPSSRPSCGTRRPATLYHRWRDGERDDVQLLDGYAFLLAGVIELYEATLEPERPRIRHRPGRGHARPILRRRERRLLAKRRPAPRT